MAVKGGKADIVALLLAAGAKDYLNGDNSVALPEIADPEVAKVVELWSSSGVKGLKSAIPRVRGLCVLRSMAFRLFNSEASEANQDFKLFLHDTQLSQDVCLF